MEGLILKIERFSIHDGPGIRTVVFMKGCPLRCTWCSSPESQRSVREVLHLEPYCKRCGKCVVECPLAAVTLSEKGVEIDRRVCSDCGLCVEICLGGAMQAKGNRMTVDEVLEEVMQDELFYRRSNGGVTISGGEVLTQAEFATEFLRRAKEQGLHTAMETSGYAQWETLGRLMTYLDLVYVDIKHMDPLIHFELTGVRNEVILENVRRVSTICPTIIRIPIVPDLEESFSGSSFSPIIRSAKRHIAGWAGSMSLKMFRSHRKAIWRG
jgi:pyruvate formate lyase activating enzyme